MSPIVSSGIVLAWVVGSMLCGIALRSHLPEDHFNSNSKDAIRIATGLIGTMVALVLGLLVASSKAYYDSQVAEVTQMSAHVIALDRILADYGPEANQSRNALRAVAVRALDRIWPNTHTSSLSADPSTSDTESMHAAVLRLTPHDDVQRSLKNSAINTMDNLQQTRWLLYEQNQTGLPRALLIMLVLWLAILFLSFGTFTPPNWTAATSLLLAAVSVCGAVLMILAMYRPYHGLIQVPSEPLRSAITHLGR